MNQLSKFVILFIVGYLPNAAFSNSYIFAIGDAGASVNTVQYKAPGGSYTNIADGSPFVDYLGISFVNQDNGWVVGDNDKILKVQNATTSPVWSTQTSPTSGTNLRGIHFVDANNGWVVGNNGGAIIHTSNGGANWVSQVNPDFGGNSLRGVSFLNLNTGWAVGQSGIILHTTDGGNNWGIQTTPSSENLNFVSFAPGTTKGWAVGGNGTIWNTTDGINWSAQTSNTSEQLLGVNFIDENNGIAVGANGTIVSTVNGGATWSPETSGSSEQLRAVTILSVEDKIKAWVSGTNGTILKNNDLLGDALWTLRASNTTVTLRGITGFPMVPEPARIAIFFGVTAFLLCVIRKKQN